MGLPLLFILISICSLTVLIIYKMTYHRKKITDMTGMTIAMTIGMSAGLTVGVIIGIVFSDNYFMATVSGMGIGMIAGFLTGIPVSMIAVLDGMLSGIMGGMMGAMLGKMMTTEYHDAIVKIMFLLSLSTYFILLSLIQKEVNQDKPSFFQKPLFILIVFGIVFVIFQQFGPIFTDAEAPIEHDDTEHHH